MSSLQELCFKKMAKTMHSAPPLLQEQIMGTTVAVVKEELKQEVYEKTKEEVKKTVELEFSTILKHLVPEIMQDIVTSMTTPARPRVNFRQKYKQLKPEVVNCAIQIAENTVNQMESYYVHRAFVQLHNMSSNSMSPRGIPTRGLGSPTDTISIEGSSDELSLNSDDSDESDDDWY